MSGEVLSTILQPFWLVHERDTFSVHALQVELDGIVLHAWATRIRPGVWGWQIEYDSYQVDGTVQTDDVEVVRTFIERAILAFIASSGGAWRAHQALPDRPRATPHRPRPPG